MIVEPDFLTHWKTVMLAAELQDRAAPLYVIALWAHCQQRKTDTFCNMVPNALKGVCRYEGEANRLRAALERCGFIEVKGETIVVHGWAEVNASLVANWRNGKSGGRPRAPNSVRSMRGDYDETQTKPRRNPAPKKRNPNETDKRREEKRRKDNNPSPPPPALAPGAAPAGGAEPPPSGGGVEGVAVSSRTPSAPKPEKPPDRPRERNALFYALAEATDGPPDRLTAPMLRACGVALAHIRRVAPGLTPEEIRRRAGNYRALFAGAMLTASALAKHWARCENPPAAAPGKRKGEFDDAW
jgi:hypothetical protein